MSNGKKHESLDTQLAEFERLVKYFEGHTEGGVLDHRVAATLRMLCENQLARYNMTSEQRAELHAAIEAI